MSETAKRDAGLPWPSEIEAILATVDASAQSCIQQPASGLARGADRWSVGSATVYHFADAERMNRYIESVAAMNDRIPFAISPALGGHEQWLVTAAPDGHPGHLPELHADPDDLVGALGQGLRQLHDLAVPEILRAESESGSDPIVDPIIERCTAAVEAGAVDGSALPHPYDRYQPEELLAMFVEGHAVQSDVEQAPVWCHGDAVAERFMVNGGTFTGFDRMENPVLADRHLDLATMHRSVQLHFGPEAVFRFYESYGRDPSLVLLEHYILGSHLMSGLADARPVPPA